MDRGLRHIALKTRDLGRTARFYLDVLGLRTAFPHEGMLFLETPGGRDLLNFVATRRTFDPAAGGLDHFGLHFPRALPNVGSMPRLCSRSARSVGWFNGWSASPRAVAWRCSRCHARPPRNRSALSRASRTARRPNPVAVATKVSRVAVSQKRSLRSRESGGSILAAARRRGSVTFASIVMPSR